MSERTYAKLKNKDSTTVTSMFNELSHNKDFKLELIKDSNNTESSNLKYSFGNLSLHSNQSFIQSCPFSLSNPSHCPLGGTCHTCPPRVQTKLKIGQPGDKYEQEADRMADQVMRMIEPGVQHKCTECEKRKDDEKIQMKPLKSHISPIVQRQTMEENDEDEEEMIQAKSNGGVSKVMSSFKNKLIASKGGGSPLPSNTNQFMSNAFGMDFSHVRIHDDNNAHQMNNHIQALAFTHGADIYFTNGMYIPGIKSGQHLLAHELTHVVQQKRIHPTHETPYIIQRKSDDDRNNYLPIKVHVNKQMTQDEYKVAAMQQIFGGVIQNVKWRHLKKTYSPEGSPYTLHVEINLLKKYRGVVSKERGISIKEGGGITGAKERAQTFNAGPASAEKSALLKEIDRRYFEAIKDETKAKIKPSEKAKAELWRTIRDEVLFQHEYITNLPPKVKELIKFSINGKVLTPADYDKLFDIAKKIEKMPAAQANDYASKVTATTKDLDVFEASLDNYIAEMAQRSKHAQEHERIQTKLYGLKELYLKLRSLESWERIANAPMGTAQRDVQIDAKEFAKSEIRKLRPELEKQLKRHGFSGLSEFKAYIKKFEIGFRQEAANIAKHILEKYAGMLYRESERYKDRTEVQALHDQLGDVRTEYMVQQKHQKEVDRLHMQRWMGAHQTYVPPKSQEQKYHEAEVARHKKSVNLEVAKLAKTNPVFNEEQLPSDKQIDKGKLAAADVDGLQALLLTHIAGRIRQTKEAIGEIDSEPEQIYKMVKLMPLFYSQLGIRPGSIYEAIITDKMKEDKILKLIIGIAVALASIALVVLTAGAATPFVAAGAAIAGAGLSGYIAYHDYQEYVKEKKLAAVGFVDDPSAAWLVVSVVGAAFDMAAAAKALKAIGESADAVRAFRALEQSNDLKSLNDFSKALKALEEESKITTKVRLAAEKAAEARKGFSKATEELTFAIASKAYSLPGPLTDPDVYKALVKMARQAIKTKIYDVQKFIEELKLAKIRAGLGDLTPEELANAKNAWEEGKVLEAASESKSVTQVGEIIATPPFQRGFIRFQLVGNERDVELLKAAKEGANVYVFKNAQGQVIYVGYTERTTFTRLGEHLAKDKPGEFLGETSYIEIRGKGLLEREARALEEDLIQELKPKWNKELTPYQNKYGTTPNPDDVKEANNTLIRLEIRFAY